MKTLAFRGNILRIALVAALAASLHGCTALAEHFSERNRLVGCWYGHGEQTTPGEDVHWVVQRSRNGDFKARFRAFIGDKLVTDQTEIGRWSFSTGLYTVVTTAIAEPGQRTNAVHFEDSYDVPDLDARPLIYINLRNKIRYVSQPVSCDFELPQSPHPTP